MPEIVVTREDRERALEILWREPNACADHIVERWLAEGGSSVCEEIDGVQNVTLFGPEYCVAFGLARTRAETVEAIAAWTEDPVAQLKRRMTEQRGLHGMAKAIRAGAWKGNG